MSRPRLEDHIYLTSPQVAGEIGLSWCQIYRRIAREVFPPPTLTRNGLPLFSREWTKMAKKQLAAERSRRKGNQRAKAQTS